MSLFCNRFNNEAKILESLVKYLSNACDNKVSVIEGGMCMPMLNLFGPPVPQRCLVPPVASPQREVD